MEMQFYPPGWITSNSATQWAAALNIDSLSENYNTGQGNNACGGAIEYVNFAYIQTDGTPYPPGSPSPLGPFVQTNANTLFDSQSGVRFSSHILDVERAHARFVDGPFVQHCFLG
jgi:hypothetical protein